MTPWPLPTWPDVPVRLVLDEPDSGHGVALARPNELTALRERYRSEVEATPADA